MISSQNVSRLVAKQVEVHLGEGISDFHHASSILQGNYWCDKRHAIS